MADLNTNVRYIKGVGEAKAKALSKLGIETLQDLVSYFPRGYEDRTAIKTIGELIPGETVCVRGMVAATPKLSHIRRGMDIVKVRVVDERDSLDLTFFNQTYIKDSLHQGESYIFYGKVGGTLLHHEMINPEFERESASGKITGRIMPVYSLTSGITRNFLIKAVAQGLEECGDLLPDPLPKSVQTELNLAQARFAYNNIHFPKDVSALELSRRRLIFEEFYVLACALHMMRGRRTVKSGIKTYGKSAEEFIDALPFKLTNAQRRAIDEAISDMQSGNLMSRLVQGDVGSGKTVVAASCIWYICRAGFQAAFMAPTEILAEQHYKTLTGFLEPFGIKVELITGSMTAKSRREANARLASGEADVAVGTHALLSDSVTFDNLGLVIADEQHRFGVQQRSALSEKGKTPHVLVMSATPIPRTLALIVYGELDVSVIDELPPGRQPVETFAVGEKMRARIYNFIRKLVSEGRQVYIVCPMVEENEELGTNDLKSAKEYADKLQNEVFPDLTVGLVHGKMKAKEKAEIMTSFSAGKIDILVSTTVIEVGVDVPNAALMVVENADRFGLSQLHQLRGRVGRGKHKSYCVLFEGAGGDTAKERLEVMCKTNDGFKIAEEDLKLRGPGDFFGSRQHGLPEMKLAGLSTDMDLLKLATESAKETVAKDPMLTAPENRPLSEYVASMIEKNSGSFN